MVAINESFFDGLIDRTAAKGFNAIMKDIFLKLTRRILFLPPVILWVFLVKEFFSKKALIVEDTFAVFAVTKYYLDNIFTGIFPSWNPYTLWGMAHLRQIGEFNPLWFVMPLLTSLGSDYYTAFLLVLIAYFLIGLWGFYRLVKVIFDDAYLSYWAFLLLLFSSSGLTMFVQPTILMIFVPTVWFFYFLIQFAKTRTVSSVLFLSFCLFQVVTTYMPFYFLIVFFLTAVIVSALYPRVVWQTIKALVSFIKWHPVYSVCCLTGLGLACLSQIFTWLSLQDGFVSLARPSVLTFNDVSDSGVPAVEFIRDFSPLGLWLFSAGAEVIRYGRQIFNLNELSYYDQRFFYVPFLAHMVFYFSIFSRGHRRGLVFLLCGVCLFFLVLGPITPVYEFLFERVFFFKMFRNLFLLEVFLIAFYIMFVVEQVYSFLNSVQANRLARYLKVVFLSIVFSVFVRYLATQTQVQPSTQWTALGCFILFLVYAFPRQKIPRAMFFLGLYVLTIIQPIGVIRNFMASACETRPLIILKSTEIQSVKPKFFYSRPQSDKDSIESLDEYDRYRQFCFYYISQQDSPGFIGKNLGYPTQWSNLLHNKVKTNELNAYTTNKFYLYDRIHWGTDADLDYSQFAKDLQTHKNAAYVSLEPGELPPDAGANSPAGGEIADQAQALSADTEQFVVKSFTVNSLRVSTNFTQAKFLVYNDSYHPHWKVYINKKEGRLLRSNLAFKGVWLPAGANDVVFEFQPLGGNWLGFIMLGYSFGLFAVCLVHLRGEKGNV